MPHRALQPDRLVAESVVRIAGIAFLVRAPGHLLDLGDDASYVGFTGSAPAVGDEPVSVEVAAGDPAPPPSARRIFNAADAWSAYLLPDGDRTIAITPPGAGVLVSARFDLDLTRVSVTCAPRLLAEGRLLDPIRYPLDQLLLMYRLAAEGGAVIHCTVVAIGDRAVICPGVSGAGKTTLARQLQGHDGLRVLSDDRAAVRCRAGAYVAWGTPWPGEGGCAQNQGRPLAAIGFLEKGRAAGREPLSPREALARLAQVASVPWYDREVGPRVFDGLAALCARVPASTLTFAPDASAASAVHALAAAQGRVPRGMAKAPTPAWEGRVALAASLLTLALIILGFEVVGRVRLARWRAGYEQSGFGRMTVASRNPVLEWEYRPNKHVRAWGDITTNRHGFRERADLTLEKAPGVERVAFVGDSLTLGLGVPEAQTFVRRFDALANEVRSSPKTQALNFGIGGYDAVQVAELLRSRALAFDPDQVVYALCWNDFDFEDASRSMGLYFRPPGSFFLRALRDARRRLVGEEYHHGHFAETRAVVFGAIARMNEAVRERGGKFRVAIVPIFSTGAAGEPQMARGWDPYPLADLQAELVAFLEANHVPFLDLLPAFRASGLAPGQVALDAWHPNPEGCRVIAEALVQSVLSDSPARSRP